MFAYNITFIVSPEEENLLIDYIRRKLVPLLFSPESPGHNPELKKIVEAGGEKPSPEHGSSLALSGNFDTEEHALLWNDQFLIPALEDFHIKFGERVLFFITLLATLDL